MLDDSQIKMYVCQAWVIIVVKKQQVSSVKSLALNLLRNQTPAKKLYAKVKI